MKPWQAIGCLALIGAAWGITQPFSKIAVSEGYRHFGLIFWQFVIAVIILGVINLRQGGRLPLGARQIRVYVIIAVIGTLLPNAAGYEAARHLPAALGSKVPMTAMMT